MRGGEKFSLRLLRFPVWFLLELKNWLEKDIIDEPFKYRYTSRQAPIDNCYLSTRNYKELDYYTDLEPDREFDVYTMNNRQKCVDPHNFLGRDESGKFTRTFNFIAPWS